jgi:hypothetical protein
MRLTVLFWNINRKPLFQQVGRLAKTYGADIIALAESPLPIPPLLNIVSDKAGVAFLLVPSNCERLTLLARFDPWWLRPAHEDVYSSICELTAPSVPGLLLTFVHLPSKLHSDDLDQFTCCQLLSDAIRQTEKRLGHERTVVVGDLNLNPFEAGVVAASGLHAVMSASVAEGLHRTVRGQEFPFFYNPMWGRLGDSSPGPPGTHYRSGSGQFEHFWHTIDQVLLRPGLLRSFSNERLVIPEDDGEAPLTTPQGHPGGETGSDHLPLVFSLDIQPERGEDR